MLFNSYLFLLVFLPVCLTGYFLLNRLGKFRAGQCFLLLMSGWFYAYAGLESLPILVGSIGGNFLFARCLHRAQSRKKGIFLLSLLFNLGLLFYFKYFDFFIYNVNRFLHTGLDLHSLLLPLGVSFFTFQQIAYLMDVYRGNAGTYSFLDYASFVCFFPSLSSGPIILHSELIPQFQDEGRKRFSWANFSQGLYLLSLGLAKKVLIADTFGAAASWGLSNVEILDTTNALFTCLAYTFQIYFDFSGYCDMGLAVGKMLNLDLPVNFDSPYKALSIPEFWSRWHMTLTRFFTRYVYIPLGGSRRGTARTYCNVFLIFLISGIWHGASYSYIFWGLLQGVLMVLSRWQKERLDKLHPGLQWLLTFALVSMSMVVFGAHSVADSLTIFKRLLAMEFGPLNENFLSHFFLPEIAFLTRMIPQLAFLEWRQGMLLPFAFGGALLLLLGADNAREHMLRFRPSLKNLLVTVTLLVWSILSFSSVSSFLYFEF